MRRLRWMVVSREIWEGLRVCISDACGMQGPRMQAEILASKREEAARERVGKLELLQVAINNFSNTGAVDMRTHTALILQPLIQCWCWNTMHALSFSSRGSARVVALVSRPSKGAHKSSAEETRPWTHQSGKNPIMSHLPSST